MSLLAERVRYKFDTNNPSHLKTYKAFLDTGSWGEGCPFVLEWPSFDIPTMIQQKIVKNHLDTIINALYEKNCKKAINK